MSDGEDRDSGKVGAFLLGFLVGVLVCLGAGGTLAFVQGQRIERQQAAAMHEAMAARDAAREAEERARAERGRAEKLLREAGEKKGK